MIHTSRYSRHSPADRSGRLWMYRCLQCGELTCFSKEVRQAPPFWCHPEQVKPWSNQMHWAYEAVAWIVGGGWEGSTDFDDVVEPDIDAAIERWTLDLLRAVPNVEDTTTRPHRRHLREALRLMRLWEPERLVKK